jgi:outer membrane protein, heavy metal efflux system
VSVRFRSIVQLLTILIGQPLAVAAASPDEFTMAPDAASSAAAPMPPVAPTAMPLGLDAALELTLQHNPNVVTVRQNLGVSAQAIEVARRFPTSLNPTLSVTDCPWVFERVPGDGVRRLDSLVSVQWAQPIEVGHRREIRTEMAEATYNQTRWNILQAELTALVQTYRLHQTSTYRREKLGVAQRLVEFNQRLLEVLRRQMEANQVAAADEVMAEVESQSTMQQLEVARQDYIAALTDLRQQLGMPEYAASAEPAGLFQVPKTAIPGGEAALVRMALESRPEIRSAQAQLDNSRSAVCLARADRIPIPSIGPVYERNETGASFYGVGISSPIPVLNGGGPLLRQREAEFHRDGVALDQVRLQVTIQVKAVLAKWTQAQESALRARARSEPIRVHAERMDRLYEAGQTDLVKLLTVRQRLIEAENAELDAVWQTTQVYAEVLTALGSTPLITSTPPATEPRPTAAP